MINTCKTIGCPSFGIKNSKSYRLLENDEIFCVECGFSFYLLNESEYQKYKYINNKNIYKSIGHCSKCGCYDNLIKYGRSLSKKSRKKCINCDSVFSLSTLEHQIPQNVRDVYELIYNGENLNDYKTITKTSSKVIGQKLKKLSTVLTSESVHFSSKLSLQINTKVMYIPYNSSKNSLYVIVSYCLNSNRVIHITTNYHSESELKNDMIYDGSNTSIQTMNDLRTSILNKEHEISLRQKFFEIDYGVSKLKRNESGNIIKPVYAAYRHFDILSRKLMAVHDIHHFIEHESFIYAACLSYFKEKVLDKSCHISYLREKSSPFNENTQLKLNNYWKDTWNISTFNSISYAICNLTSVHHIGYTPFVKSTNIINYIYNHPFYSQLKRMNAQNVTSLLNIIVHHYNKQL